MLLWYSEETTLPPYVTLRNKEIPELLPVYVREIEDKVKESRGLLRNVLLEPDGNG